MSVQALLLAFLPAIGPGFTPTTFDTGTLSSNVVLSNGNLTATRTDGNAGGVRSTSYKSTGKPFCSYTVGASHGSTDFLGLMSASTTGYFAAINGNTGSGAGVWLGNGNIVNNGGGAGSLGAGLVAGDVLDVCYDAVSGLVYFRRNGGPWNGSGTANPLTQTGGVAVGVGYAPAAAFSQYGSPQVGDNFTLNSGGSAFPYAPPTGWSLGWAQ
ncbi:hypothetical protein ACVWY5_003874 [Bradyrhizobium sp. USDA 3256]